MTLISSKCAAEQMQRELFDVQRRVLGPEHPDTLRSAGNLAYSLVDRLKSEPYQSRKAANERVQDLARLTGLPVRTDTSQHGESELWQAAACGDSSAVLALIGQGSELNWRNSFGASAIHAASQHGDAETVRLLLEHKALVSARDGTDATPLHYAAEYGSCNVIRNLLLAKSELDSQDIFGATPLHYAAQMGHFDIVMYLLCNAADATLEDCQGKTAQDRAKCSGKETKFEAALKSSRRDLRKEREKKGAESKEAQEALERRQRMDEERARLEMEQALRARLAAERKANELQALLLEEERARRDEQEKARRDAKAQEEAEEELRRKKIDDERWRAVARKNSVLAQAAAPEQPMVAPTVSGPTVVAASNEQAAPAVSRPIPAQTEGADAATQVDLEQCKAARQQLLVEMMLNPKQVGSSFRKLEALATAQVLDALDPQEVAQEEAAHDTALQDPCDAIHSSRRSSLRITAPPRPRPSILTRCSTPYGALVIKSQVPPKQLGSLRDSFQRASANVQTISQLEACASSPLLPQVSRAAVGIASGTRLLLQSSVVMGREVVDAVDDSCFD